MSPKDLRSPNKKHRPSAASGKAMNIESDNRPTVESVLAHHALPHLGINDLQRASAVCTSECACRDGYRLNCAEVSNLRLSCLPAGWRQAIKGNDDLWRTAARHTLPPRCCEADLWLHCMTPHFMPASESTASQVSCLPQALDCKFSCRSSYSRPSVGHFSFHFLLLPWTVYIAQHKGKIRY